MEEMSDDNSKQGAKKEEKKKQKNLAFATNNILFELVNQKLSSDELRRFEKSQESKFHENHIKKILGKAFGNVQIADQTLVALASICKVYIGELIESAREIMTEQDKDGPITPEFLQEAYRRMEYFNN